MRIVVTSVYVDDQEKALSFYTDLPGFVKEEDVIMTVLDDTCGNLLQLAQRGP
jgi:catechol 2,3-dioxygenase-like lactoylglutathione lyase family enzyme